jgi:HSP20 family molecular chaperone IbpA
MNMSLVHRGPFELEEMSTRLHRVFGHSMAPRTTRDGGKNPMMVFDWSPTIDVAETPNEFQINAELPELKKDEPCIPCTDARPGGHR